MKKRLTNYDLMRVLCCIFVIMLHIENKPFSFNVRVAYTTVFFFANGIFYMLSGKFNLERTYNTRVDVINYYRKKFISILFPYILVSVLLSMMNSYLTSDTFSIRQALIFSYTELLDKNADKALWFMYPLIGFLISAPFLSKMFHSMTDWECRIMVLIAMIWNALKVFLGNGLGVPFRFSGWLLETWILYFAAGYIVERIINKKNRWAFYLLGAAGYIITIMIRTHFLDKFQHACDYSPAFFFAVIAFYDLGINLFTIKNRYIQAVISFLASHAFYVYLFHMHVIHYLVPRIAASDTTTVKGYLLVAALSFIFSLLSAIIFRSLVILPLQFLLKKLPGLRVIRQEA